MDTQEFFTKVVTHLLKQNKKSVSDGKCRYRSDNGLKCAIGAVIPNSMYSSDMEGKIVSNLLHHYPTVKGFFNGIDPTFLTLLQRIHDGWDPEDWPRLLRETARDFNLKYPTIIETSDEDDGC